MCFELVRARAARRSDARPESQVPVCKSRACPRISGAARLVSTLLCQVDLVTAAKSVKEDFYREKRLQGAADSPYVTCVDGGVAAPRSARADAMTSACIVEAGGSETVRVVDAPSAVTWGNEACGAGRSARPAASGASAGGSARAMGPPSGRCDQISVDRGSVIHMGQGDWAISGRFLPKAGAGRSAHPGLPEPSDLIRWFGEMPSGPRLALSGARVDQRRRHCGRLERLFTDQRLNPSGSGGASVSPGWGVEDGHHASRSARLPASHLRENISVDSSANAGRSARSHIRLRLHQRAQPAAAGRSACMQCPDLHKS